MFSLDHFARNLDTPTRIIAESSCRQNPQGVISRWLVFFQCSSGKALQKDIYLRRSSGSNREPSKLATSYAYTLFQIETISVCELASMDIITTHNVLVSE